MLLSGRYGEPAEPGFLPQEELFDEQGDTEGVFKYFPQMIEEVQDWDFVNSCLDRGQKLAKGMISIVAIVKEDIESAIQGIKSHFSELKFKLEQVNHETINSFISCLPFGFASFYESLDQLKAISTITSSTAKNLMPVFADHGNTASPLMSPIWFKSLAFRREEGIMKS